jgi:DNA-binding NtrC family response regulator
MVACPSIGALKEDTMANLLIAHRAMGVRAFYAEVLEEAGHCVAVAENSSEIHAWHRRFTPDLTLLDIHLHGAKDFDGCHGELPPGEWMGPVILLCNPADLKGDTAPLRVGTVALLPIPTPEAKLLQVVAIALDRYPRSAKTSQTPRTLPMRSLNLDVGFNEARVRFEKTYLAFHLIKNQGCLTQTAQTTGLDRTTLYRKLRKFGMSARDARSGIDLNHVH